MNEENLKPKKLDTSPEKQRERGQKTSLLKKLINRKYCNESCPLFPCQLASISMSLREEGEKPKCIVKKLPFKLKQKFINIYEEGEKGIIKEAKNVLIDISMDMMNIIKEGNPEKNIKYKSVYFEHLMSFLKAIYGEKRKINANVSQNIEINVPEIVKLTNKILKEKNEHK